jgi:hypothetical protein
MKWVEGGQLVGLILGVERLGHPTVSITLGTYSHAIPTMQEEEALIAGLVFAGRPQ